MVSVEATAYMIAEGLAARWKARKAKRSRAAAKKAAAAGPNPNPNPNPAKKPARASGAQVAPAAALEMVPAAAPADAGVDSDAAKPKAAPAIDVAADVPGGEQKLTPRGAGGDLEAPGLGSQARPAKAGASLCPEVRVCRVSGAKRERMQSVATEDCWDNAPAGTRCNTAHWDARLPLRILAEQALWVHHT